MTLSNETSKKGLTARRFVPAIIWFFISLFLFCLPGSDLPSVGDWMNTIHFDKWVHIGLFTVQVVLLAYPFTKTGISPQSRWTYFLKVAIACSIWGLTIEFIQKYFVPGRSFDLFDWAADSVGAGLGLLFGRWKMLRN